MRGTINGLHLVEPTKDGKGCVYTMVSQMDPKGTIPLLIVNWFAMRRPFQYMVALRDLAEERYGAEGAEEAAPAGPRRRLGRLLHNLPFRRGARRGHDRRIK